MLDQDTKAVAERLQGAVARSGLSMRRFAHALGTSVSRYSSYGAGRVVPSAAFLIRAERIAHAFEAAREAGVPSLLDALESIRRGASRGDDDWTYAVALEARDRLQDILHHRPSLVAAWEVQPPESVDERWATLMAAFISHEFGEAGLLAPVWTKARKLKVAWVLDTPRLSAGEVRRQTPKWLAERNIFIAEKDLVTL